jgi:glutamate racemase
LDLIESAAIAAERSGAKRIGVIATAATARSGAYGRAIRRRVPDAQVIEVAAPALVPLVEAGELHGVRTRAAVAQACATLTGSIDAAILGCTHYPLLANHFSAVFGTGIPVLDPAEVHAERAAELVTGLGIAPGSGRVECVTTGDAQAFTASLQTLAGDLDPAIRSLKAA